MHDKDPKDFLANFHEHAQNHGKKVEQKSIADHNQKVKQRVAKILTTVQQSKGELEKLRQVNPNAYNSMMGMVQAMMTMAKDYIVPHSSDKHTKQEEPVQKKEAAAPVHLPIGSHRGSGRDARQHPKEVVAVPNGPETKKGIIQAQTGKTTDPRKVGMQQPLSALKYAQVINQGQSKKDPEEEARNPR